MRKKKDPPVRNQGVCIDTCSTLGICAERMVKDAIIGIIFGSATYEGRVAIG